MTRIYMDYCDIPVAVLSSSIAVAFFFIGSIALPINL